MKNKIMVSYVMILIIICSFHISVAGVDDNQLVEDNIGIYNPEILWWYDLDAPSFGSAAVGDIDGDSKQEIVFGTYFNDEHIYALNAETGLLHWKYYTDGCNDASPTIADVDLDGELEVVVPASSPYRVYCFNGLTGDVEWSTSTGYPNCIDSPPAVADVDNDYKPEVILGTFYGYVFCLNGEDGSICWDINLGTDSYIQSGPNILDLDSDGQLDIVVAQYSGDCRIYALRGNDGSTLWHSDIPQDYMYHGASFADIDEDGKPEIAIGCYDKHVYVLNGEDGSLEWSYTAPYYIAAPTSIADLNNDGHLEVVFVSYNILGVLSNTGDLLWSYPAGGSSFRGASIADVNGDGTLDVAFGSTDGKLIVLSGDNGQIVWSYNLQAHYGDTFDIDHAPVICDFDGDGKLDIFVVGGYGTSSPSTENHGRAYALTAGEGTDPGWTKFRYDLRNSAHFSSNQAPNAPIINGPSEVGFVEIEYEFSFNSSDQDGDEIFYYIDWGDGSVEEWIGPFNSGNAITVSHEWFDTGYYEIKAKARDILGNEGSWSDVFFMLIGENNPPSIPIINGPNTGDVGTEYTFYFCSYDTEFHDIYYWVRWGDGTPEIKWSGPFSDGEAFTCDHIFEKEGKITIIAKAKDIHGAESDWGSLEVEMPREKPKFHYKQRFFPIIKDLLTVLLYQIQIFDFQL